MGQRAAAAALVSLVVLAAAGIYVLSTAPGRAGPARARRDAHGRGGRRTPVHCFATTYRDVMPAPDDGRAVSADTCKAWCTAHSPVYTELDAICCEYILYAHSEVDHCTWTNGMSGVNGSAPRVRCDANRPDETMPQPASGALTTRPECMAWCAGLRPGHRVDLDCCQLIVRVDSKGNPSSECTWTDASSFSLT
ncbi:hypothetical protein KFE25_012936 [Diacronema lutheri]|uniref:Uncharacterized protein n=1 Tax=Diacronema lutheri TaxID=2081491 RepID=A0A8J6C8S5_DIALT|nr:hypothetical protein KFE25_012936 [Diacronema lutheri]